MAITGVVESTNPPVHLVLGTNALQYVRSNLKAFNEQVATWEAVSSGTNYS